MYKIGAHLSMAGGHHLALQRAADIGCNALQLFLASPKGWNFQRLSDDQIELFKKTKKELAIGPVYFHASYLVNFADTNRIGPLSVSLITHELKVASRMGVRGSIIHLGSFKTNGNGHEHLCDNIKKALDKIPDDVFFIIENAGNRKIGLKIEEIGEIFKTINDPRLRVCLDTCHLHAAGYDLGTEESFNKFLKEFDELVGIDNIEVWHMNDSKDPFESLRDRHENLGYGEVGEQVFINILNNPRTKHHPFIIETPGFDGLGPDKQNVDILRSWIKKS